MNNDSTSNERRKSKKLPKRDKSKANKRQSKLRKRPPYLKLIRVNKGRYEVKRRGRWEVVSSFILRPIEVVEIDDGDIYRVDIVSADRTERNQLIPRSAFNKKSSLDGHIQRVGFSYLGTDTEVRLLRAFIDDQFKTSNLPRRRGETRIGRFDGKWVYPDGVITKDGPEDPPSIIAIPSQGVAPVIYPYIAESDFKRLAKLVFDNITKLNEPHVIWPIIGWFFATTLKPVLVDIFKHFPFLVLQGEPGAGKTAKIKHIFLPLFGCFQKELYSAKKTDFTLTRRLSNSNAVPIGLDEYRPSEMSKSSKEILNYALRLAYDGAIDERGTPELNVTKFELTTPAVIMGEELVEDPALIDRIVALSLDKSSLNQERREAFHILSESDLSGFIARYIQFTLAPKNWKKLAMNRREFVHRILSELSEEPPSDRMVDNIAVALFGIAVFRAFARKQGYQFDKEQRPDYEELVRSMAANLIPESRTQRLQVDEFVQWVILTANLAPDDRNVPWRIKSERLYFHFESAYLSWANQRNMQPMDQRTILGQLNRREGTYIIGTSKQRMPIFDYGGVTMYR